MSIYHLLVLLFPVALLVIVVLLVVAARRRRSGETPEPLDASAAPPARVIRAEDDARS